MKKKAYIAIAASAILINSANASILFDVPLAKKCYAIYNKLVAIAEVQTTNKCQYELSSAKSHTESAALRISEDAFSKYELDNAINALRHAQVYSCEEEEGIVEAEQGLLEIKSQIKSQN